MPVVELHRSSLQSLVGGASRKQISDSLPFLGLDIESEKGEVIRVEYSPNRPDYSTAYGISLGLQGLLGIKIGPVNLRIKRSGIYSAMVDSGVTGVRPYVTGIIAKGGTVNAMLIKQLMTMQEDLHFGIGRRRTKSSIGMHDLDKISFPLTYTTARRDHSFVPLNSGKSLTISQILADTDVGRIYGGILKGSQNVPILLDSAGSTVSFPPVVNAAETAVTLKTRNFLVEITGMRKQDAEDMLSVVALVLQTAGFSLEELCISGARNSTPKMEPRRIVLKPALVNKTLGLGLSATQIASCLKKSRLGATARNGSITCVVPPYRFDILGTMDLVEEAALGYGIGNLEPVLSPPLTLGRTSRASAQLRVVSLLMVGLGYMEAFNSSLTSRRVLCEMAGRPGKRVISVLDSKSQEHTVLRDSVLPGLVENLSRNIHASYPQRLFETGAVFRRGNPVDEAVSLACLSAHGDASFTETKSALQSMLGIGFGIEIQTRAAAVPMLEDGRASYVFAGKRKIGVLGEISTRVAANYKMRMPMAGFEISLSGLIFD